MTIADRIAELYWNSAMSDPERRGRVLRLTEADEAALSVWIMKGGDMYAMAQWGFDSRFMGMRVESGAAITEVV